MTKRPSGYVQPIRLQIEGQHARAAEGSYADSETTGYIRNCRDGTDEYVYPPESFAWQDVPAPPQRQGSGGPLAGFFRALDGG